MCGDWSREAFHLLQLRHLVILGAVIYLSLHDEHGVNWAGLNLQQSIRLNSFAACSDCRALRSEHAVKRWRIRRLITSCFPILEHWHHPHQDSGSGQRLFMQYSQRAAFASSAPQCDDNVALGGSSLFYFTDCRSSVWYCCRGWILQKLDRTLVRAWCCRTGPCRNISH